MMNRPQQGFHQFLRKLLLLTCKYKEEVIDLPKRYHKLDLVFKKKHYQDIR